MIEIQFSTLLLCYGLCFGFQNKLPFLYGKKEFLDSLLQCSYCLGFHCGWLSWLFIFFAMGCPEQTVVSAVSSILIHSFVSSAFCYTLDSLIQLVESHTLEE